MHLNLPPLFSSSRHKNHSHIEVDTKRKMDELLALFDEEPSSSHQPQPGRIEKDDSSDSDKEDSNPKSNVRAVEGDRKAATSDAKTGIRMINRRISGADLLDLLMESPFYSPASLCAMSLVTLNTLLADPAAVVDATNVCGRTNLVTVGIVFSNSGTRISSSGNAFCVLTLGSLQSGPAITVMLFGTAYGTHCRTCHAGKVVALLGPRLLPPKESSFARDTAVSFSVSEERQIRLVADARDYGTCPAPIRGKNDAGQWVSNARTCGHYVDKTVCAYCSKHRNLEHTKGPALSRGLSSSGATRAPNAMQQLRSDASMTSRRYLASNNQRVLVLPTQPTPAASRESIAQRQSDQRLSHLRSGRLDPSKLRPSLPIRAQSTMNNSLLNPPKAARLHSTALLPSPAVAREPSKVTMPVERNDDSQGVCFNRPKNRMLDQRLLSNSLLNPNQSVMPLESSNSSDPSLLSNTPHVANPKASLINPYARKPISSAVTTAEPALKAKATPAALAGESNANASAGERESSSSHRDNRAKEDWMHHAAKRKPGINARRDSGGRKPKAVKLNTNTACFDGSVPVPKPSLSFAPRRPQLNTADAPPPLPSSRTPVLDPKRRDELLALQGEMAAKLKQLKQTSVAPTIRRVTPKHGDPCSDERQPKDSRQSIFGGEASIDLDAVKTATSKFANEAAAEEYSRHRNRLVELEELEEAKEASAAKRNPHGQQSSNKTGGGSLIQKEWYCASCNRTYKAFPQHCRRADHPIKAKRMIHESKTTGEKRQALSETRSEDGGLKIGSGLEWSRFR